MTTAPATIDLSLFDLAAAAALVLVVAGLSLWMKLGLERSLVVAAVRMVLQLALIGFILEALFRHSALGWVALTAAVMLGAAAFEVTSRQQHRFRGAWGPAVGAIAMFLSSFALAVVTLVAFVQPEPWYAPRYAIPILGMLLGNTMNGTALALERLLSTVQIGRAHV